MESKRASGRQMNTVFIDVAMSPTVETVNNLN